MMLLVIICASLLSLSMGFKPVSIESRINGGSDADITEFPFLVSVRFNGIHSCGGSIIDERVILTIADCIDWRNITQLTVRAGSSLLHEGGVVHNVSAKHVHVFYNPVTYQNNLGLIRLAEPLEFNERIQPITLPHQFTDVLGGAEVTIAGWGLLEGTGAFSPVLQKAQTVVALRESCIAAYSNFLNEVTDGQICTASVEDGGIMPCWGDHGGPIMFHGVAIAMMAWGLNCGSAPRPAVNERISQHINLIAAVRAGWEFEN